jgi:hypothetical protein
MGTLGRSIALASTLAFMAGCAGNYFREYQQAHPDWVFVFPDSEANLEQTLASLYAPPPLGVQLSIRRLEILRIDTEPWQSVPFQGLRTGAITSSNAESYAVIAHFTCRGRVDLQSYYGEKVAWYLLPDNRLRAFDHYEFLEACTVHNDFHPTSAAKASLEKALEARVASGYPPSMVHVKQLYQKGIAYARAERVEDAKRMLREGRSAFDSSGDDKATEFETPGVRLEVSRLDEAAGLRAVLIREIEAAEARALAAQ